MDFYLETPRIDAPRVHLRRLTMRDAEDIFEYSRDPLVAEHVLWDAQRSIGEAKSYIRYMLKKYRAGEASSWAIALNDTGKVIGTIGYMWIQNENSCAEVGYSLSRAYWNMGLMTEALAALLNYSFRVLQLNRVEAVHETTNPASGAVMRKCGMIHEGTMRQKMINKGKYVDVEMYAILRRDYGKTVK